MRHTERAWPPSLHLASLVEASGEFRQFEGDFGFEETAEATVRL
jgi:hypothetical protein